MKKIAIIGGRTFTDYNFAENEINKIINHNDISCVISGGARGADKIAEKYAILYNIPTEIIIPDWSIGRHAGFIRNSDIVNKSDIIIAFWNGISKGTLDSIKKAKKANKEMYIIDISNTQLI